jgi:hypothetical protein
VSPVLFQPTGGKTAGATSDGALERQVVLIFGRLLRAIDDNDLYGTLGRRELQSELFL